MRPRHVLAALLMLATGLLVAPAHAAESYVLPSSGTVTLEGRGYGHGKGMSQWGAYGGARSGAGYRDILAFYYPGTSPANQGNPAIRVLVSADTDNQVEVVAEPGMQADTGAGPQALSVTAGTPSRWRISRTSAGVVVDGLVGATWHRWAGEPAARGVTLTAPSGVVGIVLPSGKTVHYRGAARGVVDGTRLRTVNEVAVEDYLRGVVPAEMPASWPADAVRAQAVAARTYAAQDMRTHGSRAWHTCDTTACQVYGGTTGEHAGSDAAVRATAGEILTHGGAPAFTQFSAANGGWTAAGTVPYQVAKADPWDGAVPSTAHRWSAEVDVARLAAAYPAVGTPTAITVTGRTGHGEWGGRVTTLTVSGTTGSVAVTGDQFRSALGLRSTWWALPRTAVPDPQPPAQNRSDFTADGDADLLSVSADGRLHAYPGNGRGGFATPVRYGFGWSAMRHVLRTPDLSGDGHPDVLAVDQAGRLLMYRTTSAQFTAPVQIGRGWQTMRHLAAAGDVTGDGRDDLVATTADGRMRIYPGHGDGSFATPRMLGYGWNAMTRVLPAGDWDGDGRNDLLAVDTTGRLLLYPGTGAGGFHAARQIGSGWSGMRLLAAVEDWDGDARPDLMAVSADGSLWRYPWAGTSFTARSQAGSGWHAMVRLF